MDTGKHRKRRQGGNMRRDVTLTQRGVVTGTLAARRRLMLQLAPVLAVSRCTFGQVCGQ